MKLNNKLSTKQEQIRHYSDQSNARRALGQLKRRDNVRHVQMFRTTITDRRRKDFGKLQYSVYVTFKAA